MYTTTSGLHTTPGLESASLREGGGVFCCKGQGEGVFCSEGEEASTESGVGEGGSAAAAL